MSTPNRAEFDTKVVKKIDEIQKLSDELYDYAHGITPAGNDADYVNDQSARIASAADAVSNIFKAVKPTIL